MKQHYLLEKLLILFKKHKSSPFIFTLFFTLFWGLDGIGQTTFSNTSDVCPKDGNSTGTTSTIAVNGLGNIVSVSVRIPNISHTYYDDLDIMLISPTGQRIILMSDAGGNNDGNGNRNYNFTQGGVVLSDSEQPTPSENVSPTNYVDGNGDTYPEGNPTITQMNQFTGNPNGNWILRVIDDTYQDTGCLIGGWSITITDNVSYCVPSSTSSTSFIRSISTVGTLTDNSFTGLPNYANNGYGNYSSTTIASQIPGAGINFNIELGGNGQAIRAYVDWNNDGIFNETTELSYSSGGTTLTGGTTFGIIVPPTQTPGNYRIRIRTRESATINPCSSLGSGEAEDYTIAVIADCAAKITSVTNGSACGAGSSVVLSVQGNAATTSYRWYTTAIDGTPISGATSNSYTTTALSNSTTYYVTAWNGSCETRFRVPVEAVILSTTDINLTPSSPNVCGEDNTVSISALGDIVKENLLIQDFETGLGTWTTSIINNSGAGADSQWSVKTSPYQSNSTVVWKPAVNSGAVGSIGNRFAFTTSDYSGSNIVTYLTSPVVDPSQFNTLTLAFDHYYSNYGNDTGRIQVNVNGSGWAAVNPLAGTVFNSDLGSASIFKNEIIDLSSYANPSITSLQLRFVYTATFDDGWAIDNIKLSGTRPLNTNFTWSGAVTVFIDAACTIPYTSQSVTTVYVKPAGAQMNESSWTFSATATLGNGCPVTKDITVNNNTKTWQGVTNNWNDPSNWIPNGVPDITNCVVIPSNGNISNIQNAPAAYAKNIVIKNGGTLQIQPQQSLTVKETVTVASGGNFEIENGGSLVQVDNVTNTGVIRMKRNTNIKTFDYVYWSSPVANFAASAVSPSTSAGLIYKWLPTTTTGYASNFGNWTGGNENMTVGKGYIIRAPNSWTPTPSIYTATFTGVPNNGDITIPISRSTYVGDPYAGPTATPVTKNDDNWNLIGNPYPSAIDAVAFLNTNATIIVKFVDLWTHGDAPEAIASPFYQNFTLNYNPNNYNRYNALGGTQHSFDGKIAAGQGFFVLMNDAGATTENIQFNNSMRSNLHRNDQFYRTTSATSTERHRIWLKMISPSLNSVDILLGYASNATNQIDASFDAPNKGIKVNYELYSLCENKGFLIQGRALPFDVSDEIPLGIKISENGIHTISITKVDGLFNDTTQKIFLEDRTLGVVHDLTLTPYSFTENVGINENRFVLRFDNGTLGNTDFTFDTIKVFTNESINVAASNETIKSVKVYDLLGRVLGSFQNINETNFVTNKVSKTQNPLLIEVTLENGNSKTFKVIY